MTVRRVITVNILLTGEFMCSHFVDPVINIGEDRNGMFAMTELAMHVGSGEKF